MFRATRKLVLVALVSGLAACNDGSVAPRSHTVDAGTAGVQGITATLTMTDTVNFTFTINPSVYQSVYLGAGNSVRFPAGSVCDPSSSYGTSEWDNACTPASSPIVVNASAWLDAAGHPRVDFGTHLRFVPTTVATDWVTLVFTDLSAAVDPTTDILYCSTSYSTCVSELSGDATLVTVKNPITGLVTRRIKHFSGYSVGAGDCVPTDDMPCTEGGIGMNRIGHGAKLPGFKIGSASNVQTGAVSGKTFGQLLVSRVAFSGYMFATGDADENEVAVSTRLTA